MKSPESEDKEEKAAEEGEEGEGEKEEAKDFEVEKILNRKKSKGQWQYLVRWAGFDETEDTWEPIENLAGMFYVRGSAVFLMCQLRK